MPTVESIPEPLASPIFEKICGLLAEANATSPRSLKEVEQIVTTVRDHLSRDVSAKQVLIVVRRNWPFWVKIEIARCFNIPGHNQVPADHLLKLVGASNGALNVCLDEPFSSWKGALVVVPANEKDFSSIEWNLIQLYGQILKFALRG